MNEERDAEGLPSFANPRNATAGSIKLLDSREVAKRPLDFLAHGLGAYDGPDLSSENDVHQLLDTLNIPRNTPIQVTDSLDGLIAAVDHLNELRHELDYATDGAVIKVIDRATREALGFTSRAPRWAAAYKFLPEQAETTINSITIQVGRTGVLTPVAELTPVLVSGTTVSRATLHNQAEINRKDIRIGDTVIIVKAGEIIPAVVKVIEEKRPANTVRYSIEKAVGGKCPSCFSPITKDQDEDKNQAKAKTKEMITWRCTNYTCPAQAINRIIQFASRKALDIEGLGDSVAEAVVHRGLVKTPLDLFDLDFITLSELNLGTRFEPRLFGEKRTTKLLESLKQAKSQPLHRWILSIGIRQVGETASSECARLFYTFAELFESQTLKLNAEKGIKETWVKDYPASPKNHIIDPKEKKRRQGIAKGYRARIKELQIELAPYSIASELGGIASQSIIDFFASSAGQHVLEKLKALGIDPISENYAPKPSEVDTSALIFTGETFVITGSLSQPRPAFKKQIESLGGKVSSSISKNTHYLLAGEKAGSKAEKAEQLGVTVLDEAAFNAKISEGV